mmetsp:Transcript_87719/g.178906  ORF Transcript_87719/g.178906 Transcript_87719/m.178906 type:complete len:94 (+) Transcript_87719:2125-2406(+)
MHLNESDVILCRQQNGYHFLKKLRITLQCEGFSDLLTQIRKLHLIQHQNYCHFFFFSCLWEMPQVCAGNPARSLTWVEFSNPQKYKSYDNLKY